MAKYAAVVGRERLVENEFNLNIPRYVETFEAEESIDLNAVQTEINKLEESLGSVTSKMNMHLEELGL